MVFGFVPMFAPWIGYFLYDYGWRYAAAAPVLYSAIIVVWLAFRYPETLPKENRKKLSLGKLAKDYVHVFSTRLTIFYAMACGFTFATILLTLITASQIGQDVYGVTWFGAMLFATIAVTIIFISMLNARLLEKFGMRTVSHACLLLSILGAFFLAAVVYMGSVNMWVLYGALTFMIAPQAAFMTNFQAIAMIPHGDNAGVGASVTGGTITLVGTIVSSIFGQFYDGTPWVLVAGSLLPLFCALGLILVLWRGKLFGYTEKLKEAY